MMSGPRFLVGFSMVALAVCLKVGGSPLPQEVASETSPGPAQQQANQMPAMTPEMMDKFKLFMQMQQQTAGTNRPAEAEEQPKNEPQPEARPLSLAELSATVKELFFRSNSLAADLALKKLEAIDRSYELVGAELPIDSRRLLEFSRNVDQQCDNREFYDAMIQTKELVDRNHENLRNYMAECLLSYQETCRNEARLIEELEALKRSQAGGWSTIDGLRLAVETLARGRRLNRETLAMQALQDLLNSHDNGHYRLSTELLDICAAMDQLADSYHIELVRPTDFSVKQALEPFRLNMDVCRQLEAANYKHFVQVHLQHNTRLW